jgi:hypothetical protein
MQQRMAALDAERADDQVYRGPYGKALASQVPVIGGGPEGEFRVG